MIEQHERGMCPNGHAVPATKKFCTQCGQGVVAQRSDSPATDNALLNDDPTNSEIAAATGSNNAGSPWSRLVQRPKLLVAIASGVVVMLVAIVIGVTSGHSPSDAAFNGSASDASSTTTEPPTTTTMSSSTTQTTSTTAMSTTASPSDGRLAGVDWPSVISDLDCTEASNTGVEVVGARYADARRNGTIDAFVWVDCVHPTSSWPSQLEVFDGSSDPRAPRRMAVLIPQSDGLFIKSVSFGDKTVTVDAAKYSPDDANCCPSLVVQQVFDWTGAIFVRR